MSTIITHEVRVKYNNGERARFVEADYTQAIALAESLQKLPTAVQVWVNELVINKVYDWQR